MKMRELEQRTGVGRETIRYYLKEGLLPEPERPKPNVAHYSDAHVRAIVAIKKLQADRFLPLAAIKRALNGDISGLPPETIAYPHFTDLLASRLGAGAGDEGFQPLADVLARHRDVALDIAMLTSVGVIAPRGTGEGALVTRLDAQILGLWADMRAAGFSRGLGFEGDVFAEDIKRAQDIAKQDVRNFLSRVQGRLDEVSAAAMAQRGMELSHALRGLFYVKAILAELRRRFQRDGTNGNARG